LHNWYSTALFLYILTYEEAHAPVKSHPRRMERKIRVGCPMAQWLTLKAGASVRWEEKMSLAMHTVSQRIHIYTHIYIYIYV